MATESDSFKTLSPFCLTSTYLHCQLIIWWAEGNCSLTKPMAVSQGRKEGQTVCYNALIDRGLEPTNDGMIYLYGKKSICWWTKVTFKYLEIMLQVARKPTMCNSSLG